MNHPRRIYLLDPKKLSPETIAVAFAKTSRSPKSFDEIAAELSDESSADFHEKWVVGYGHSSVAEHAVLHVAVENISRLAIECLESNRLASYTEKSSRYQVWDEDSFHVPAEIAGTTLEETYTNTCRMLFREYQSVFDLVSGYLQKTLKRNKGESKRAFTSRLRSTCADACRYFLPTSALANVGLSINARALEHAIRKMLSHPLEEVRQIGEEIKKVSVLNVPTLVKYANANNYLTNIGKVISEVSSDFPKDSPASADWCTCISHDENGASKVLAALLYRFNSVSFDGAYKFISGLDQEGKKALAAVLLGNLDQHDIPARELEYAHIAFDLILDQGAYFELKRHRMMTQTPQPFTPHLGYATPRLLVDAGAGQVFSDAMNQACAAYEKIHLTSPDAAAYILPNAFNRRVLLSMNLRSARHLINLRCATNAHFAIRRPTQRMAAIVREKYPLFADFFTSDTCETWESIESAYFISTK